MKVIHLIFFKKIENYRNLNQLIYIYLLFMVNKMYKFVFLFLCHVIQTNIFTSGQNIKKAGIMLIFLHVNMLIITMTGSNP